MIFWLLLRKIDKMTDRQEQAHIIMAHIQELKVEVTQFLDTFEEQPPTSPCNYVKTEMALFKPLDTFFEIQSIKQK